MRDETRLDALLPPEMAARAESVGVAKASRDALSLFALAILAGAFIALGAIFSSVAITGATELPFGVGRVLAGVVFSLGLILVIVGGAELFTGNNLIAMAWASRSISTRALLRNWLIVYAGNFVGALGTAVLVLGTAPETFGDGALAATMLSIGNAKCGLDFGVAFSRGVLCNALVCLAVWMCFSARSVTDKVVAIVFPIAAFVAAGFEHSIANMYFISVALGLEATAGEGTWAAIGKSSADFPDLSWSAFLVDNLLPVTLGNIVGGTLLVAAVYWLVYLRPRAAARDE